jgi:hypothetical protein
MRREGDEKIRKYKIGEQLKRYIVISERLPNIQFTSKAAVRKINQVGMTGRLQMHIASLPLSSTISTR